MKKHAVALIEAFDEDKWPSIECPVCQEGRLAKQPVPDGESEWHIDHETASWSDWGDPSDIRGTFGIRFRCTNESGCGDAVYLLGEVEVDYVQYHYQGDEMFVTRFRLRTAFPPLRVVDHPEGVPDAVAKQLRQVGALLFMNPDAAMSALRLAEELVLDDQQIPRHTSAGKFISLDERLSMFKAEKPHLDDVIDLLLAVKWVGNESVHDVVRSPNEVLSIVKLLEIALNSLYSVSDQDEALRHARAINQKRGFTAPVPQSSAGAVES
ncbi:DUF4145 domain-containing protein [Rhodococcus sp. SORGH_AS_0301]|uniref:DUF4145 domain-containing protein n=1 Tax=Rhodococcus sp. SORGH_AS_0301 TaxID=3041780 RepID=UPI00278801D0|nr:DUF4145 domain-containing protein [Rhodococcus sp. SORGH_AS_0301]MDQ1178674.1 hypothetical protein [Rhodococcus sp. SORGH_AS_0301]